MSVKFLAQGNKGVCLYDWFESLRLVILRLTTRLCPVHVFLLKSMNLSSLWIFIRVGLSFWITKNDIILINTQRHFKQKQEVSKICTRTFRRLSCHLHDWKLWRFLAFLQKYLTKPKTNMVLKKNLSAWLDMFDIIYVCTAWIFV